MSRDYKPGVKPKSRKKSNPILTGVGLGVAVSLVIAVVMMFWLKPGDPESRSTSTTTDVRAVTQPAKPQPAQTLGSAANKTEKPRFDFYTILPGLEEPISEQDIQQAEASKEPTNYYLQAGSFQVSEEADNLKAKLALLGIEARVETATIPEKGVWYRVRVGPFDSVSDFTKMRESLAQNGVTASPVKVHRR